MAYTTVNDPSAHFQTTTYTGNAGSQTITNGGHSNLRPDWVWIKYRSSGDHVVVDSNRGATKEIKPNANSAEATAVNGVTGFVTDGFTANGAGDYNGSGNYVSWQWAAGGAAPTKTYKVVVVSDSGNKYRFRNSADNATYAASAVTLDLQEGGTYTFDVSDNTVDSHPFVLGTSANSNEYSTGVTYKLDGVTKTYSQYTSGFSAATTRQLIITVAASAPTLYYWCSVHSGMGGQVNTNSTFGSTNFDGSNLSIATTNTTAGLSIVKWTGTGSNATLGHGLGSKPQQVMIKALDRSDNWRIGSDSLTSWGYNIALDVDNAEWSNSGVFNNTAPTTSVFSVGSDGATNANGEEYIAYVFHDVKGYSKFGQYLGNGDSNGSFIYTGFKPAFIMLKRRDAVNHWHMLDDARDPVNYLERHILADLSNAEGTNTWCDFTSTGFKLRTNLVGVNGSNESYIYWAFASKPIVASNGIVGLAR